MFVSEKLEEKKLYFYCYIFLEDFFGYVRGCFVIYEDFSHNTLPYVPYEESHYPPHRHVFLRYESCEEFVQVFLRVR